MTITITSQKEDRKKEKEKERERKRKKTHLVAVFGDEGHHERGELEAGGEVGRVSVELHEQQLERVRGQDHAPHVHHRLQHHDRVLRPRHTCPATRSSQAKNRGWCRHADVITAKASVVGNAPDPASCDCDCDCDIENDSSSPLSHELRNALVET